jgi:glycosyltransferase involved in cell wall biosynthesis
MPANIIIDCERMKYPHTGLYHYCSHLGNALIKQQNDTPSSLAFYVPPSAEGFLGNNIEYSIQKWWHKLYHPAAAKYQLWHGTYQGSNYFPVQKKVKKLLTIHDLNFLYDTNKTVEKQKKYLQKVQDLIDRSDQLTAISAFTLQCVQEHLNTDNIPVEIIYNGCNLPGKNEAFQRPLFITGDTAYLFSIGTIARKKNFHTLPALLAENDFKLIIAGITQDEKYLQKIIEEANKHGVSDRLILPGAITESEKWWLLQNMHAFVFPSISEGFGLPVVEAMSFGKPVLLSTNTCLPEIGADAAYYFKSFDAEDMQQTLSESLEHFYHHPEQPQLLKKRAAFFSWDEAAKKYWGVYDKIIEGK